jgi:hypothetical protein
MFLLPGGYIRCESDFRRVHSRPIGRIVRLEERINEPGELLGEVGEDAVAVESDCR